MSDKLQKLLAHAGLGSRREIETWIEAGRITVNGKRAKLGDRAELSDRILVDGKVVALSQQRLEPLTALVYHKPEGQICTVKDPKGRPTVFENLPKLPRGRWVSVGRLDLNSSGLLLFTNSGDLANRLMHPSTGVEREYLVRIRGRASDDTLKKLMSEGVMIDGQSAKFKTVMPADASEEGTNHWYRVVLSEGRYREVRRMWDAVGHTVSRLKRIRYGTVKLGRELRQGRSSKMAPKQLEKLVVAAGLGDEFAAQLYSAGNPRQAPKKRISTVRSNTKAYDKQPSSSNKVKKKTPSSPTGNSKRSSPFKKAGAGAGATAKKRATYRKKR